MNVGFRVIHFGVTKDAEKKIKGFRLFFTAEDSLERLTREIVEYFEKGFPDIRYLGKTLYIFGLHPSGESALSFPINAKYGAELEKILKKNASAKNIGEGQVEVNFG